MNHSYVYLSRVPAQSLSRVQLFETPWTLARQAPLSMRFSRQEYWSGLPFPTPRDLPTQGLNPGLLHCRETLYCLSHQGSPCFHSNQLIKILVRSWTGTSFRRTQLGGWWIHLAAGRQDLNNQETVQLWEQKIGTSLVRKSTPHFRVFFVFPY